jgi:hypothetical protein
MSQPVESGCGDPRSRRSVKIPGLVATFGPDEPLIIGADGEVFSLCKPIFVLPTETVRLRIMYADGLPINRLSVYLRKYPTSKVFHTIGSGGLPGLSRPDDAGHSLKHSSESKGPLDSA